MTIERDPTGDTGLDLTSAVDDISRDLGFGEEADETPELDLDADEAPLDDEEVAPEATETTVETPVAREMPKSWSKDKAALWARLDDEAKDYYTTREKQFLDGLEQYKGDAGFARELKEVITPYRAYLTAQGLTEKQVVQNLLNAQYRLTNGTPEERRAAYDQLGRQMGLVAAQQADAGKPTLDPALQNLQKQVESLQSVITAGQQAEFARAQAEADREIDAFSSDPANAYFSEVGQDMIPLVKSGLTLKDAYDKAVWANPVTRQKELDRIQTEAAARLKEKAKTEGAAARRASSTNVRDAQSRKAPTEPKGSIEDTLRDTLSSIKNRAH